MLTGEFLTVETSGPGAPTRTQTKTLFDRVGFAARRNGTAARVATSAPALPSISRLDLTVVNVLPGKQDTSVQPLYETQLAQIREAMRPIGTRLQSGGLQSNDGAVMEALHVRFFTNLLRSATTGFAAAADLQTATLETGFLSRAVHTEPRIFAATSRAGIDGQTPFLALGFDLMRDQVTPVGRPGQTKAASFGFQTARGLSLNVIEEQLLRRMNPDGSVTPVGAIAILTEARRTGAGTQTLTPANPAALDSLALSDEAKSRISEALSKGRVVTAPRSAVTLSGRARIGWLEADPTTGAVEGLLEDGSHGSLYEYSGLITAVLRNTVNQRQYMEFLGGFVVGLITGIVINITFNLITNPITNKFIQIAVGQSGQGIAGLWLDIVEASLPPFARAGFVLGLFIASAYFNFVQAVDPPIPGAILGLRPNLGPPSPGGSPGVTVAVALDPLVVLDEGGARIPLAYRARIRNTGPAAGTFQLTFPNPPAGFEMRSSLPSIDLAAGDAAEIGVCAVPATALPAPGTPSSFDVRAAGTGVNTTASQPFAVPTVRGFLLSTSVQQLSGTPGSTSPVDLRLQSVGNVPQTINLSSTLDNGLTLAGLPASVALTAGQTVTRSLTFTATSSTPAGTALNARIQGSVEPATLLIDASAALRYEVVSAAASSVASASEGAGRLGRTDIFLTLSQIGRPVSLLSGACTDGLRAQVSSLLSVLIAQANAPYLASARTQLQNAKQALDTSTCANVANALALIGIAIGELNTALSSPAAYDFDFFLVPNSQLATPGSPAAFNMFLRNRGTTQSTYTLALGPLPSGVTGGLSQTSITLAAGASNPSGTPAITITPSTGTAFEFSITVSVNGVAGSARTMKGYLGARTEFISVASVTATPAFTNAGGLVGVAARIANSVNQARSVSVALAIKQGATTVRTGPTRAVTLSVQSLMTTVDFGNIDTTGLANGSYTLEVTVNDAGTGQLVPGGQGTGTLLIGQPVTSALSVTPTNIAPGASRVTTTLNTRFTTPQGGGSAFTLLGSAVTEGGAESLALNGNHLYACGTRALSVVNVANPAAPATLLNTGQAQIGTQGFTPKCRAFPNGTRLVYFSNNGSNNGATTFHIFDTTNPAVPSVSGSPLGSPIPFTGELRFAGNVAVTSTVWFRYLLSNGAIFEQHGQIFTYDLLNQFNQITRGGVSFAEPAVDPVGDDPKFGMLIANPTTALIGGSSSNGSNTNGEGRLFVVDPSPFFPKGLKTVRVPGTAWIIPVPASGNTVLMPALTQGWNNPGGTQYDFNPRGNLALVTVDLTDPRDPKILKTVDTGIAASAVQATQISATSYALHLGYPGNNPAAPARLFLVDISDPLNPTLTQGPATYTYSNALGASGVLGEIVFSSGILYVAAPTGILTYQLGGSAVPNYTAQLVVPKGGKSTYDPASFSIAPTIASGTASDTLTWTNPGVEQITFASNIAGAAPGDTIPVVSSGSVNFTTSLGNGTIPLGGASAAVEQIISIDPAARTVAPGELAPYTLTLRNPGTTAVTYTLAAAGVPASWVTLPTVPGIPAGGQTTVTLDLRSALADAAGSYGFVITAAAGGTSGSVQGTLVLQGTGSIGAQVSTNALGVTTQLTPASATGGQGTPVEYVLRVTNAGNTPDTYNLSAALPAGVSGSFAQNSVQVPPGLGNFREVRLTLTAQQGSAPGPRNFTVTAASQTNNSVTAQSAGTLNVVANGVNVTLAPASASPGGTFTMTVRNTGTVNDTFDLSLAGPGALLATLSTAAVTLASGASQNVTVATGQAAFASQGPLTIVAGARARGNTAVSAIAQGQSLEGDDRGVQSSAHRTRAARPGNFPAERQQRRHGRRRIHRPHRHPYRTRPSLPRQPRRNRGANDSHLPPPGRHHRTRGARRGAHRRANGHGDGRGRIEDRRFDQSHGRRHARHRRPVDR